MAVLKAVLIGKVKDYGDKNSKDSINKPWKTAMFKVAQNGEVTATKLGFVGDSVADIKNHGGEQKAIFANSYQNYEKWEIFLGFKNLPFGAMGENLTIDGLNEDNVCIGDIHQIGSLIIQVSQPRKPCFKISKRWLNKNMTSEIFQTGRTGWYYRVLKNGSCKAGDDVKVLQKDIVGMSVMQLNQLFYAPDENLHLMSKLNELNSLAGNWKDDIQKRILGTYDIEYMRKL